MIDVVTTQPAAMPWQHIWGANIVGIAFVLFVLWLFAESCWPSRAEREDTDA